MQQNCINKVFLLGEIITEPRCHTYDGVRKEYHFTLVTKENFQKKTELAEHVEWHHIRVESTILNQKLTLIKGQSLHIEGKIQTTRINNAEDVKRYKTEVIAYSIIAIKQPG